MSNTSATGGYLTPENTPLPGPLSLEDFLHDVIVGISGYAGALVRPKWQVNPPKQPAIDTDWIAFAVQQVPTDANAFTQLDADDVTQLSRQDDVQVQVAFYGPNALDNVRAFRDGFWINQNLEALLLAGLGFKGVTPAIRGPDLVNERWVDRWEMTLTLVQRVLRTYQILPFASAAGSIHTVVGDEDLTLTFEVEGS